MISILVDCSIEQQEYIEDCQVCCQPIVLNVQVPAEGFPRVSLKRDND
ncbi:CPXCG motif-containing cysteine-rich protein [Pseudomonadota bacterium]